MVTHGIDRARVEEAIEQAERLTSGEIRVSIAPLFWGDVWSAARRAFVRLGMDRTRERNGVLFFVVPSRRRFCVLGDAGIHAKVGSAFWEAVVREVAGPFRAGDMTLGLERGIAAVGARLAEAFPRRDDDRDELPNAVDMTSH